MNNFAVFILTHGRAKKVTTYNTLRSHGYTGDIYLIIDNEDLQIGEYKRIYGDMVHVFDKKEQAKKTQTLDNFEKRNTVLYARNYCFEFAKSIGIEYFLELDDDYSCFSYKIDKNADYIKYKVVKNLDLLFKNTLKYFKSISASCISYAQEGDFIAGENTIFKSINRKRKLMQTFFCSVNRPFEFISRMNDDVTTYCLQGSRGHLFITLPQISIKQGDTQQTKGGLTEMYLEMGTYVKSFYSVMACPSFVKVKMMGNIHRRLHHFINWECAVPKIIREEFKK